MNARDSAATGIKAARSTSTISSLAAREDQRRVRPDDEGRIDQVRGGVLSLAQARLASGDGGVCRHYRSVAANSDLSLA
jgi:hypothetical protein